MSQSERELFIIEKLAGELSNADRKNFEAELAEIQAQKALDEKVAEAQAQVTSGIESITVDGVTISLRDLTKTETDYQIAYIWIQELVAAQAAAAAKEIAEIKAEKAQLQLEVVDISGKRDAAVAQAEELQKQVADLQNQLASQPKVATVETNLNANLRELVAQREAAKPAIYDLHPLDMLKKRYSAILADTGEPVEFGYLELGKYRVVTAQEAEEIGARFRAEQAQKSNTDISTDNHADNALDVITPPAAPFQEAHPELVGLELVERDVSGEVSAKTVEERLKALEIAVFETLAQRVAALESGKVGAA